MFERPSNRVLIVLSVLVAAFVLAFADAARLEEARTPALAQRTALVKNLKLTDLCLFTEARYTRHLSQADVHAPFQDHPSALEHFPTGALVMPPAAIANGVRRAIEPALARNEAVEKR